MAMTPPAMAHFADGGAEAGGNDDQCGDFGGGIHVAAR
jgi:hypothetical protein